MTFRELVRRGPYAHAWMGLSLMTAISVQEETAWPIVAFALLQIGIGIFGIVIDRQRSTENPPKWPRHINASRFPLSERTQRLKAILAKLGGEEQQPPEPRKEKPRR